MRRSRLSSPTVVRQALRMLTFSCLLCTTLVRWTNAAPSRNANQGQHGVLPAPYIVEGEPTARCQWPWMAALITSDRLFACGATLISPQWLLTAAHCVYNATVQLYAAVSTYNLTAQDEALKIPIADIVINDGYVPTAYGLNDIALLRLASPIQLNTSDCVEAIRLPVPNYDGVGNPMCTIIGWGRTSLVSTDPISNELTQKSVTVIDEEACQQKWDKSAFGSRPIYPQNVCIDETTSSSACEGDSGGPLQCNVVGRGWTIVGVSSWGSSACKRYPSVYMKVSDYDRWILSVIQTSRRSTTTTTTTTTRKMQPRRHRRHNG